MNLNVKYGFFAIALLFGALFFSGIIFLTLPRLPSSPVEAGDTSLVLLVALAAASVYIYVVWKQIRDENDDEFDDEFLYHNRKFKK
ncbi:MAG: hypothetical protein FWE78_02555 [Methanimicrococcus sp.]|nr:hypothetical protein [Methanimicrococcus sp.]